MQGDVVANGAAAPRELLRPDTVAGYLQARGVLDAAGAHVDVLAGGVSSLVFAVRTPGLRVVVKQALPRLRVAQEWRAAPWRSLIEARALQVLGRHTPDAVPPVLDIDEERWVVTIPEAPAGHRTWKDDLLRGHADTAVAARLGDVLGVWHAATAGDLDVAREFGSTVVFDQLRTDPFHRTVARTHPDLAGAIGRVVDRMQAGRRCRVSGDYSPKNVLLAPGTLWVIDLEVAHYGDPAFDLGFLLTHLMLKAVHRPAGLPGYQACAMSFLDAYRQHAAPATEPAHLVGQLGCLLLARVDGKSPAEYLDEPARKTVRRVGRALLGGGVLDLPAAWAVVTTEVTEADAR